MENFKEIFLSYDKDEINDLVVKLEEKGISYKVNSPETNLESTYGIQNSSPIKLLVSDDQKEEALELLNISETKMDVDMSDYSEDDLLDIILNKEEWHDSMISAAQEELKKRKISFSQEAIEEYQSAKIEKLENGEQMSGKRLTFIWILTLFGSLFGTITGIAIMFSTTKGFNGKKYYVYNYKSRVHGAILAGVGLGVVIFQFYYIYYVLLT